MVYEQPRTDTPARACWVRWIVLGGLVLGLVGMEQPVAAQEATVCEEAFATAEAAYLNGAFDDAIRLLSPCLDRSEVPKEQAIPAYRLLSLAHLQKDELPEARAAIVNILSLRPAYEADPVEDPPSYVSLVSIVRREVQPALADEAPAEERRTPFFRRTSTWISIAGTLIVGGVVTMVATGTSDDGGSGGDPPGGQGALPDPPPTPSGH